VGRIVLNKLKYLIPPLAIAIMIFIVSAQSNIKIPDLGISIEDKILHILAYLVFGLTLVYSISGISTDISRRKLFVLLVAIGGLYALSDELHQYYVPGRESDIVDILADITGIIISFFVYPLILKFIKLFEKTNV